MKLEVNTDSKEKPAYKNEKTVRLTIGDVVPYYISYLRLDMCWKSGKSLKKGPLSKKS